jgi:hypothetical protein
VLPHVTDQWPPVSRLSFAHDRPLVCIWPSHRTPDAARSASSTSRPSTVGTMTIMRSAVSRRRLLYLYDMSDTHLVLCSGFARHPNAAKHCKSKHCGRHSASFRWDQLVQPSSLQCVSDSHRCRELCWLVDLQKLVFRLKLAAHFCKHHGAQTCDVIAQQAQDKTNLRASLTASRNSAPASRSTSPISTSSVFAARSAMLRSAFSCSARSSCS